MQWQIEVQYLEAVFPGDLESGYKFKLFHWEHLNFCPKQSGNPVKTGHINDRDGLMSG